MRSAPAGAFEPSPAGAIIIFCGILCQIAQLYVSIRTRKHRLDVTGDP